MKVMKKPLMQINFVSNNRKEMEFKLYPNITCPNTAESATEILEKVFITNKCTQCKTSRTLKTDIPITR